MAEERQHAQKSFWRWGSLTFGASARPARLTAIAVNLFAVLVLTTSAVAAAKESLPGDFFYGLKTSIEQVQVVTANSPERTAWVRVNIAAERLTEVQRALASDKNDAADSAATAYVSTMVQAQRDIESARARGVPTAEIQKSLKETISRQDAVLEQASVKGAVSTEHAIREVQERVGPSLNDTAGIGGATSTPAIGLPAIGAAPDRSPVARTPSPTTSVATATVLIVQAVVEAPATHPPVQVAILPPATAIPATPQGVNTAQPTVTATGTPTTTGNSGDLVPTPTGNVTVTVSPTVEGQIAGSEEPTSTATPRPTWTRQPTLTNTATSTATSTPTPTRMSTATPTIIRQVRGFNLDDNTDTGTRQPATTPGVEVTSVPPTQPPATPTSSGNAPPPPTPTISGHSPPPPSTTATSTPTGPGQATSEATRAPAQATKTPTTVVALPTTSPTATNRPSTTSPVEYFPLGPTGPSTR